ncbi:L,D-transpeptidase family protein [Salmonirosea aquatica]|uniref:L,D-transpeptidase family protein n=1 Tax=Salmonirosea aquatica TaxID=2654236 RepID=A0A7C9FQN5_9BACT|nr:L,D-transpeptidase family protein [Cytophagaceae bacterium SJW1-29]
MKFFFLTILFGGLLLLSACSSDRSKPATEDSSRPPTSQSASKPEFSYDPKAAGDSLKQWVDSLALKVDFPEIEKKKGAAQLFAFYQNRNFSPAWGAGTSQKLMEIISQIDREGLNPSNFPLDALRSLVDSAQSGKVSARTGARLDLLLSASYLKLADLLATGKIKADQLSADWHIKDQVPDTLGVYLQKAVAGQVERSLASLRPGFGQYTKLRRHLAQYRRLSAAGGWPTVEAGADLAPGDSSQRIIAVRRRLAVTGDLDSTLAPQQQNARYDSSLIEAVNRYQQRNGLIVQPEITDRMVQAMNIPAEDRLTQLMLNLDRIRWISTGPMPPTYALVNIPEYRLHVVEDGSEVKVMPVVVGKVMNATPVFKDQIEHVEFSPYWNVPTSIATAELWPKIRASRSYLDRNHMEILNGWGNNARVVSRSSVDWGNLRNYRIRQKPGPWNALGQVKFMFPNQYAIYLHDTPSEQLFGETRRAFSHGCIRIADPVWFADWILPQFNRDEVTEKMNDRQLEIVKLDQEIPVYIVYLTAFEDGEGRLNFRPDLYGLDKRLTPEFDK